MGLNKKGILELAEVLTHNVKKYDQDTFGEPRPSCGTVGCLAGHAYAMEIGSKEYNERAKKSKNYWIWDDGNFQANCVEAGKKLLGITGTEVFGSSSDWPGDLSDEYDEAKTGKQRVIVALKALSRLRADGSIDPDPTKIHTKIPQLEGCYE